VPLAAVLWNGGSSFGGVIAFLFADLIVIPILDIYRKYYGKRMAWFLLGTIYASMSKESGKKKRYTPPRFARYRDAKATIFLPQ
jgi:hypothetical protein